MSPTIENMRTLLESRDVQGFLKAYIKYRASQPSEPTVLGLTQSVLPTVLRQGFDSDTLDAATVVALWHAVRGGNLILVDNELLEGINLRIDKALHVIDPTARLPAARLPIFGDEEKRFTAGARPPAPLKPLREISATIPEFKRIAITSTFMVGTWSMADAFICTKNLCASNQEHEFLQAVRQYFPSLRCYPNVPLRNCIDIDKLSELLPPRVRNYAWAAQVDVLLATEDEDPVAGIELDSVRHDDEERAEGDELKNQLFVLAGLPLIRIRPGDELLVRAEDFYDLLMRESDALDRLRPRRLRPRRTHEALVPAESYGRTISAPQ
ncbi:DUF2726 domain-containing protein [Burkholderia cepacia]|uniref:DUF2726 domain-containing protein n=1 Tax=Burkholderia cepacia TaxID=292 RepID=UPI001C936A44|nr:DUF2726 domain-containing protein [Burkholderia cepacia]MBY4714901.1 DUF2726 domain-containing protein [Burkholderia cepacia]MBY4739008.1 DUF2726 domain-containing protein [Burkholderia cepacia]MBY4744071.1 DUF2726 domain-containing protein [Burkholderia cepacia]MBY4757056.1 DUF2726 domain-containing protein [Burkholderia cepacia]MBY4777078.1 DUF2726 domain-containing protein [Burkholderia cepacia]